MAIAEEETDADPRNGRWSEQFIEILEHLTRSTGMGMELPNSVHSAS
ncbi:MAG: hypothetical protein ACLR5S_11645 [Ruminococcus sp.]